MFLAGTKLTSLTTAFSHGTPVAVTRWSVGHPSVDNAWPSTLSTETPTNARKPQKIPSSWICYPRPRHPGGCHPLRTLSAALWQPAMSSSLQSVYCTLYIHYCLFATTPLPSEGKKKTIFEFSPVFYLFAPKSKFIAFDLISFRSTQLCIQCAPIRNLCAFDRSDLPRLVKHPMCICTNCVRSKRACSVQSC